MKIFEKIRRLSLAVLLLALMLSLTFPAMAAETKTPFREITASHGDAEFTYELFLTDQNGMSVKNPRNLSAGDTLYVEIQLQRNDFGGKSYNGFGIEFRMLTRGLRYNEDGTTLRSGTPVRLASYMDGDSVGFAWYDMAQEGEPFPNPVLAGSWSYTVENPAIINITVPVALIYVAEEKQEHIPVGPAWLFLDPNGGELVGKDVSGEYRSGTVVTLPDARFGEYVFDGWSDGVRLYPAGSEYTVSGIVTLTAQWSGLVRDRYVTLVLGGGEVVGEDISGYYADGEVIILPDAQREGYRFLGWSDGVNLYAPGDEYIVNNTVNLTAIWERIPDEQMEPTAPGEQGKNCIICGRDYWLIPGISICWICLLIILLGLLILILLLWKRRWVKYSLVNGDVALNYKNGDKAVHVEVILCDGDQEYRLNRSRKVREKQRLRYIRNITEMEIVNIQPGKYKGKLIITDDSHATVRKCRIKALDKELKKKKK